MNSDFHHSQENVLEPEEEITRKRSWSCIVRPRVSFNLEDIPPTPSNGESMEKGEELEKKREEGEPGSLDMLQQRFNTLLQEGITEGHRFALSSDLWRYATVSSHCDLLITLQHNDDEIYMKKAVTWLVDTIKKFEPNLRIEIRHHRLTNCYALYLTADYKSLLKGAELCHLKKAVKVKFGGGLRDFCFDDAQCYVGIEMKNTFLSGMERALIVKQLMENVRAPRGGLILHLPDKRVQVPDGMGVVSRLIASGVVDNVLPLHNTEYLKHLQQNWVLTLFEEQPLEMIKDYFGTEIAMYFGWLGHMTTALWFPAILGMFMFFFGGFKYKNTKEDLDKQDAFQLFSDICFVLFAFFNCIWSTAYLEFWKRKQAELAFKWGTYSVDSDSLLQDPRPAFKGDYLAPNPVSGRMEPYYPPWKHAVIRYGITYPITFLCVFCMFMAMLVIFLAQDAANYYFAGSLLLGWICYVPMVIYALMIVTSDKVYRHLALFLNDLENYRTDDEYEDFLISKIVIFQFVTAFGSLFYIAFYLKDMRRLQETLATLLITRQITQNVMETAVPFMMEKLKLSRLTYKMTKSMSDHTLRKHVEEVKKKRETQGYDTSPTFSLGSPTSPVRNRFKSQRMTSADNQLHLLENISQQSPSFSLRSPRLPMPEFVPNSDGPELSQAELESLMSVYARPLDDYLEMFIQFGYVLLFSPAFPLAAACALANNLIEIRVDAFKLCNTVQRPFGRQVKDIGAWQKAMELLGTVGVMVNCALIGQSGLVQRLWPDLSWGGQILLVVVLEHLILAAKLVVDVAVPDVPHWIRIETAKQEHFRREAFKRESRLLPSVPVSQEVTPCDPSDPSPVGTVGVPPLPNDIIPSPSNRPLVKRRSITPMMRFSSFMKRDKNNSIDKN